MPTGRRVGVQNVNKTCQKSRQEYIGTRNVCFGASLQSDQIEPIWCTKNIMEYSRPERIREKYSMCRICTSHLRGWQNYVEALTD